MTNYLPELVFSRRYAMGHRLIDGDHEKCQIPHGHNELVVVSLIPGRNAPDDLRLNGKDNMLLAFADAKSKWHEFIDTRIDHSLQLSDKDPLLQYFNEHEPQRFEQIVVTPGDPTTELMTALFSSKLESFLKEQGSLLTVNYVEIHETPTNTVRINGNPSLYLPKMNKPDEDCWWNRPDMDVLDADCI